MNQPTTLAETDAPPAPLSGTVTTVMEASAPAVADARAERERLRRELAEAENAVVAAEEAALRRLETAVGEWSTEQGLRSADALDRAAAWAIAAELDDVTTNRDVVLDTIHPSLHGEIAKAFDRRIEELEERSQAHQPLGEAPDPPGPVVVAAAWLRREPQGIGLIVLDVGSDEVERAARAALVEVAGRGDIRTVAHLPGGLHLTVDTEAGGLDGGGVASALAEHMAGKLEGSAGWPADARVEVEAVDGDPARAIAAALPAGGDGD